MKLNKKKLLSLFFIFGLFALAYFLAPQIAHAQDLHTDLTYHVGGATGWIFTVWKVMLGITNVIVVVFLLFLAAINILHLQYDTYQIKKSLPLLIGGAIAANFSILICRMIVDAAQVLTATFAGNPEKLVGDYLCAFAIGNGNPSFWGGTGAVLSIIMVIIAGFIILIIVGVLAFLLWIRKTVIFLLVALSPVAFIFYAFPPTQGLFKQWWSYFLKFVFMGPLLMMIFWIASIIGAEGCDPASGFQWNMALTVIGISIIGMTIPFKLGGAVMGAWGKAGQWATGTGKEGFLRKPADSFVQGKKDAWKLRANNWANKNTPLGANRAKHAMEMETLQGENKAILEKRQAQVRDKLGSKQALREAEVANSASILEEEKTKQTLAVESGNFNHISKRQMKKITGKTDTMDVAQKYIEQANSLNQMKEGLATRRSLDLKNLSIRDLREDDKFRDQLGGHKDASGAVIGGLKDSAGNLIKIKSGDFDENGEKLTVGAAPTEITFDRSIEVAEELRFKAKTETNTTKREQLVQAAKHFEDKATEFQKNYKVDATGETINYKNYLSRNLSGRRQKVLNPAITEDAEVQIMGDTHTDLVDNTDYEYKKDATTGAFILDPTTGKKIIDTDPTGKKKTKTFGTSEWRADTEDMNNGFNGELHKSSSTAAYATMVQMRAQKKVMDTAKQGDVQGLEEMQLFCDRAETAGRAGFKTEKGVEAVDKMDPTSTKQLIERIVGKGADWSTMSAADKKTAIDKVDFSKLDVTSSGSGPEGKKATANRAFVKHFLTGIETDKKLGFAKSPGTVLRKSN